MRAEAQDGAAPLASLSERKAGSLSERLIPAHRGLVELLVENEFCCLHAPPTTSSFPSSSAIHRVEANWVQNERTAMVMGTPMNAPNIPHRNVQRKQRKGQAAEICRECSRPLSSM